MKKPALALAVLPIGADLTAHLEVGVVAKPSSATAFYRHEPMPLRHRLRRERRLEECLILTS